MNFSYEGADLSKIIKKCYRRCNEYFIEYLDGSVDNYAYCDNKYEEIKKLMLEQAIERDNAFSIKKLDFMNNTYLLGMILSSLGLSLSMTKDEAKLFLIIFLFYSVRMCKKSAKKVDELRKYKMFLELINEVGEEKLNSSEYMKYVNHDTMYPTPFDITTLDGFGFGEVKMIYKEFKSKRK